MQQMNVAESRHIVKASGLNLRWTRKWQSGRGRDRQNLKELSPIHYEVYSRLPWNPHAGRKDGCGRSAESAEMNKLWDIGRGERI
jgi:hypothetical protein